MIRSARLPGRIYKPEKLLAFHVRHVRQVIQVYSQAKNLLRLTHHLQRKEIHVSSSLPEESESLLSRKVNNSTSDFTSCLRSEFQVKTPI